MADNQSSFKEILDHLGQERIITTSEVMEMLDINKYKAAGLLSSMKKLKLLVGKKGVWAKSKKDLDEASTILKNKTVSTEELAKAFHSMVLVGKGIK